MRREGTGGLTPAQKVANAAAAGAAAAVVYNNTTGTFNATVGESIPAFSLSQAQGDAVIALVNAGPVTMELVGRGGDLAGSCARQGLDSFYCPGTGYLAYRLEVVDRVGNDSFAPGHGVLLSKSRNSGLPTVLLVDPNPQDIGMIDFYRPDGTPVAVVRGDPRQLNDASFHAGTRSDSEYEYVDNFNRLHFYVIDKFRDGDGVLYYDLGVRRFDGAGDVHARRRAGRRREDDVPAGRGRLVRVPAHEHGPGRHRRRSTRTSTASRPRRRAAPGRSRSRTRSRRRRPAGRRRSRCTRRERQAAPARR